MSNFIPWKINVSKLKGKCDYHGVVIVTSRYRCVFHGRIQRRGHGVLTLLGKSQVTLGFLKHTSMDRWFLLLLEEAVHMTPSDIG